MNQNALKIAQVSMFYLPIGGGQETYIENLKNTFRELNIQTDIFQPSYKGVNNRRKDVMLLPVISKMDRFLYNSTWFVFNVALFFCGKKLNDYDLVISHYPFHYPVLKWHKKVIVLSHGLDWHQPIRRFADRYRKWAAQRCFRDRIAIVSNDTYFLRSMGIIIKPSERYFEEVAENIWFIPNCVNTQYFRPDPNIKREKIILVPRNIRKERGIHLAIEAFALFCEKNRDYKMHIIGSISDKKYYEYCNYLLNKFDIRARVSFLGSVNWMNIIDFYLKSKLVLIPTLEMEGTSLSALEAMACKTPVVSTNVGGLADIPTHKAEANAADLCKRIEEVLDDWDSYSENQHEITAKIFNADNWKGAWASVIKKTLNFS